MSVRKPIPVCWRRERRHAAEVSTAKAWHKEIRKTDCQALDFAQIRSMDKPPACRTLRTMAGLEEVFSFQAGNVLGADSPHLKKGQFT